MGAGGSTVAASAYVEPALDGSPARGALRQLGVRIFDELTALMEDRAASVLLVALSPHSDSLREVADVHAARPDTPIVVLADVAESQFLEFVMAGASGFCDPTHGPEAIERTLAAVASDGVAIPRHLVRPLVTMVRDSSGHVVTGAHGPVHLSTREWEVLARLRQQRSTDEIARDLFVSQATVRSHVAAIVRKLGVHDRDEAVAILERH